jgi:hypothetical protein
LKEGRPVLDRMTGRPMWNVGVALIADGRADVADLSLPEGGFPMELGLGGLIVPELMVAIPWVKPDRNGVMVRANSVKVEGGRAGVKGAAA